MNYWIIKFAPFRRSWKEILLNGKFEIYSVRNPQARNNLLEMKRGDSVLFVHIKQPRLSVIKLTKEEFETIVELL